jgi:carbamoyltransferase|tara:strand:- start:1281 stop:2627 length:1347 start_codon:yes stop_codon:yes gene_type:complete
MIHLGISEGFHDAAVAVVEDKQILFATNIERVTGKKNDKNIPDKYIKELKDTYDYDKTVFYEHFDIKNVRRETFGLAKTEACRPYDIRNIFHHEAHYAAAYYTAPFVPDSTVVIDAIGEFDTATIWVKGRKVWSKQYPWSLGLFYSAITKRIGLKPNEDEYITMGMAAYGDVCIDMEEEIHSNCHKGFKRTKWFWHTPEDIAASAQAHLEMELLNIFAKARTYGPNVAYGGGVALNCVANSKIAPKFDNMWIFPNPGDAGSALGCVLAHNKERINFKDTYLGHDITRSTNPKLVVDTLLKRKVVGVANGKAEFGPRALGNRSLLGDVRYDIKDTVNTIKRRQKFRPFAPAILEEFVDEYFDGPTNEYMQFVSKAKHDYKSVTHVDGTARVQVVKKDCTSVLRPILEEYYERTGVPMLLNTSLNIKGKPMVNTLDDAENFQTLYGVRVL